MQAEQSRSFGNATISLPESLDETARREGVRLLSPVTARVGESWSR
jgi:hypothetical protein